MKGTHQEQELIELQRDQKAGPRANRMTEAQVVHMNEAGRSNSLSGTALRGVMPNRCLE
jgi:hypothetical protein